MSNREVLNIIIAYIVFQVSVFLIWYISDKIGERIHNKRPTYKRTKSGKIKRF